MLDKEFQIALMEKIIKFLYIRAWIEQVYIFSEIEEEEKGGKK